LVIASGGDVFSSEYGNLQWHLMPLEYALKHAVPVVFLAHSVGPFRTREESNSWTEVARHSSLITVRESLTYHYVTRELGLPPRLVHLVGDPAFLLAPPPEGTVERLLKAYGVERDRPTVALAISQGISHFAGISRHEHFEAWRQVVRMLLDELGAQVILIPHVQSASVNNDDRLIATDLLRSLNFAPDIRLVGGDHSASEFKGMIAACDLVVAERMHAAIAGLSSGVCTVVVGYSVKAKGIMTDLVGSEWASDGLVIPIQKFVRSVAAVRDIKSAWNRRAEVRELLVETVPQARARAAESFELLSEVLAQ
jgi:colanic acid/amylovoran biosynthesis protein